MALAVLAVIGLGLITGTVYMWTQQTRGIVDAFRPRIDSKVVLSGTIERLQTEGKLVVLTADVQAEARSSTRKIFLGFVDLGETTVRVRAPAKVQYIVPLRDISRDDFTFDAESRRARILLLNMHASIAEGIVVGRTHYRVQVGPIAGRQNAETARNLLAGNDIESILLRVAQ